jgi:hypothetical protein
MGFAHIQSGTGVYWSACARKNEDLRQKSPKKDWVSYENKNPRSVVKELCR